MCKPFEYRTWASEYPQNCLQNLLIQYSWAVIAAEHPALKYPVRHFGWLMTSLEHTDGEFLEFTCEDSTLSGNGRLDPWSRPMPSTPWTAYRDSEGEIQFWTTRTTVCGHEVILKIFND